MEIEGFNIKWFGRSAFLIESDKAIYTDPYLLPANQKKGDIILISHEHSDHFDRGKIKELSTVNTEIIVPPRCASGLEGKLHIMKERETVAFDSIRITAVPAYNINKFRTNQIPFHIKGTGFGYIIETNGKKIYFAGDTDFIDEIKDIKVDIALLPIGGIYTMNIEEAARAANTIKPKVLIPMHYPAKKELRANPDEFANLVDKSIKVVINPF